MTEQVPSEDLRCEVCERPVVAELGLWTPKRIVCVDCEEKQGDQRLREVAEKLAKGHDITAEDIRVAFNI